MNDSNVINKVRSEKNLFSFLKESQDKLPLIPFRTLAMIQEANKEELVFLKLFNCLKEVEQPNDYFKEFNLRLIIQIEDKVFIKKFDEDKLYVVEIGSSSKQHFVILLKNSIDKDEDSFLEDVITILNRENTGYEKQHIEDFYFLDNDFWEIQQMFKVNFNVLK